MSVLDNYPQGFVEAVKNHPPKGWVEWHPGHETVETGIKLTGVNRWADNVEVTITGEDVTVAVIQSGDYAITTQTVYPRDGAIATFAS